VVDGEPLAAPVAVLAGVAVAPQDVLLVEGDAVEERLADEHRESDHRRQREHDRGRPDDAGRRLHGFGLPGEQQGDGATGVGEMQRLKRVVEHQYRDFIHVTDQE
jgi:hypothetical protein